MHFKMSSATFGNFGYRSLCYTYSETKLLSFWWNFHHWLHWKLSIWLLPVEPVMKFSCQWWHFLLGEDSGSSIHSRDEVPYFFKFQTNYSLPSQSACPVCCHPGCSSRWRQTASFSPSLSSTTPGSGPPKPPRPVEKYRDIVIHIYKFQYKQIPLQWSCDHAIIGNAHNHYSDVTCGSYWRHK